MRAAGVAAAALHSDLPGGPGARGRSATSARGAMKLLYVSPERLLLRTARCDFLKRVGRSRCSPSTRRIASASGATTSGRNTAGSALLGDALPRRAADGADGDRRSAHRRGYPRAARPGGEPGLPRRLRPAEHLHQLRAAGERARAAARPSSRRRRRRPAPASSIAARGRRPSRPRSGCAATGHDALRFHAGMEAGREARRASPLRARRCRHHGGDDRLRHGHRPAGRPLGRPPRSAEIARELVPGDRPRRARRAAGPRPAAVRRRRHRAGPPPHRGKPGDRRAEADRARPAGGDRLDRRGGDLPAAASCCAASAKTWPEPELRRLRRLPRPAASCSTARCRRRSC